MELNFTTFCDLEFLIIFLLGKYLRVDYLENRVREDSTFKKTKYFFQNGSTKSHTPGQCIRDQFDPCDLEHADYILFVSD